MREYVLSAEGIRLLDVYLGPGEVLTGSARLLQEAKDQEATRAEQQSARLRQREMDQEEASLKAQAESISARLAKIEADREVLTKGERQRQEQAEIDRKGLASARKAD
jgi:circadian clock protein KaiC